MALSVYAWQSFIITATMFASFFAVRLTAKTKAMFLLSFGPLMPAIALLFAAFAGYTARSLLSVVVASCYSICMMTILLAFTSSTALSKLDDLPAKEKYGMPFVLPATVGWVYTLPFVAASLDSSPLTAKDYVVAAAFAVVCVLHVLADGQKHAFKQNKENAGQLLTTGLWSISRHPNYFFDWVGYIFIALLAPTTWYSWASPLAAGLQYIPTIKQSETWAAERYGASWRVYTDYVAPFVPLPGRCGVPPAEAATKAGLIHSEPVAAASEAE
eukprot:PLAT14419.1.p1 GENE.PLAT14419.1~~PLAT14419.1.p1  ORF type:complete len:272 (-),score=58.66 PLAT14419.1:76-891(-)